MPNDELINASLEFWRWVIDDIVENYAGEILLFVFGMTFFFTLGNLVWNNVQWIL